MCTYTCNGFKCDLNLFVLYPQVIQFPLRHLMKLVRWPFVTAPPGMPKLWLVPGGFTLTRCQRRPPRGSTWPQVASWSEVSWGFCREGMKSAWQRRHAKLLCGFIVMTYCGYQNVGYINICYFVWDCRLEIGSFEKLSCFDKELKKQGIYKHTHETMKKIFTKSMHCSKKEFVSVKLNCGTFQFLVVMTKSQ